MLALEYRPSVPRYAAARLARGAGAGGALHVTEVRPPRLPGSDWLPVRPRVAGICGSDQAMLKGTASLYLAALTSSPFVPGHEVVGDVTAGERRGERVIVEPALGCRARGIEPECPECAEGMHALCRNATDGDVSAGLQIGFCRETGGGWSEGLVAHSSQLHAAPPDLSDEDAVMVEPLACSLHAARALEPESAAPVIAVVGAGTIGLLTVAALRETHQHATIVCSAKHRGQELEARRLGADRVCPTDRLHLESTRVCGARRLLGHGDRELLLGGFDAVLDCVGTGESLEQSVTATKPRGTVLLVGMPGRVTADLALAWQREVRLRGAYGYTDDFPAAIELAQRLKPGRLVARGWHLRDHRAALEDAPRASRRGRPKTVFDLRDAT